MRGVRWLTALAVFSVVGGGARAHFISWPGGAAFAAWRVRPIGVPVYGPFSPWGWGGASYTNVWISYTPPAAPAAVIIVRERPEEERPFDETKFYVIRPRRKAERPERRADGREEVPARNARPAEPAREAAQPPAPNPPAPEPRPAPVPAVDVPTPREPEQVVLGRRDFAAQDYGRAERRFRLAVAADPDAPAAHFLLAQALFALAKYREAVDEVGAGMRLRADWPRGDFRVRDLYGRAEEFEEQLRHLQDVQAQFPRDPVLLMLLGYQLWFDGRREKARDLFRRAVDDAPDRTAIERFLRAP